MSTQTTRADIRRTSLDTASQTGDLVQSRRTPSLDLGFAALLAQASLFQSAGRCRIRVGFGHCESKYNRVTRGRVVLRPCLCEL